MAGCRPLQKKEGVAPESGANQFVSALRAGWGYTIETGELEHNVFNAVVPILENDRGLLDVLDVFYGKRWNTKNPDVQKHWWDFDNNIPRSERARILRSAKNSIGRFVQEPLMKRLCTHTPAWDAGKYVKEGGYIFQSLPDFSPLITEHAIFYETLLLNMFIAEKMDLKRKVPPMVIAVDEAERVLIHDTGRLRYLLRAGRGLGIHLILIVHDLSEIQDPALLGALMTNCKIQVIGGGVFDKSMIILAQHMFASEWAPDLVRSENRRKDDNGEEHIVYQHLKEISVFLEEKKKDVTSQKAGNFYIKIREKHPERFSVPLLETREPDLSYLQGRKDYINLYEEEVKAKDAWEVKKEAQQKANEIRDKAKKNKRTDLP